MYRIRNKRWEMWICTLISWSFIIDLLIQLVFLYDTSELFGTTISIIWLVSNIYVVGSYIVHDALDKNNKTPSYYIFLSGQGIAMLFLYLVLMAMMGSPGCM
ncbi:hypothetical protein [Apilactobacillus timberlakei]|uniref:Uncharacterized protein n=1 Tax=Apilactobacillus timberlakei TaxID=2008380 RepID=A0ABY2YSE5_9LACO|nr:hypothetical protein [Apilactobacillus timberlakei]TPR13159.1 hypothetical protein DYZ97_04530 [Apilactobacillus timberlakei]TPR14209.1 hypothetical protein DY048_04480 [Apilactobacillus timberlakei]TPR23336.1 hypothetical protein DY102_04660 [Apilactobacillus timberlakei]